MIHVSHLYKSYGPVRALHDISFDVPEGAVVGFLGPNGAGKSTTLRILTGFLPGDSGTVRVAGHDVSRDSLALRQQIGYLPEAAPFYPEMRIREYLKFRARLKGIPRSARRREIDTALDLVGVGDVANRIVGQLSKGYRQRVGLADALLGSPRVLILDEPTVGLDPEQLLQFREILRSVGQDRTVLLSTHILGEVEQVCDGAIIIYGGSIVAQDSSENLRRRVEDVTPVVVELRGPHGQILQELGALSEVEKVERLPESGAKSTREGEEIPPDIYRAYRVQPRKGRDPREALFRLASGHDWSLRELHREPVTLEEAFLAIVGERRGSVSASREEVA